MTEKRFANNIKSLIEDYTTEFSYEIVKIDTVNFQNEYMERFVFDDSFKNAIAKRINKSLVFDYPYLFSSAVISKLIKKLV